MNTLKENLSPYDYKILAKLSCNLCSSKQRNIYLSYFIYSHFRCVLLTRSRDLAEIWLDVKTSKLKIPYSEIFLMFHHSGKTLLDRVNSLYLKSVYN